MIKKNSVWDVKNIIDLMKEDFQLPVGDAPTYQVAAHPYTPTAYIGRTTLNGVGVYCLTDRGEHYLPRSRRYNWRWAEKKRQILNGTHLRSPK